MVANFIMQDLEAEMSRTAGDEPSLGGPFAKLNGSPGVWMPLRGLGTNGLEGEKATANVKKFLRLGGRHVDTALLYNNHREIGAAVAASGIPRSEIFLVSKIPPGEMGFAE